MALVMVLCALFLLSMIVFGLAQRMDQALAIASHDIRGLDARALAFSGLQIALHPQATLKTPALRHQTDRGHGYQTRITGEGGKLQLNWLLAGEQPTHIALLRAYLEARGLNYQEREALVDCLLDWVSPGNTQHLNGSRVAIDGTPVPGKPFQDLSEVKRVVASEPLTQLSGWENDFTLLSKGPLDLQWAGENLIGAVPGIGAARARAFVQQRSGTDKLDGTPDDVVFQTVVEAAGYLGMDPTTFATIQDLVTINDPTVRIISRGQAFDVSHTIEVVARKESAQPQILQWKEF